MAQINKSTDGIGDTSKIDDQITDNQDIDDLLASTAQTVVVIETIAAD
jgi:hypothetical protein